MGETVTLPGRMRISHSSDTGAARRWVREVAVEVGFDPRPADELALAASELATNIVKHAGSGMLLLSSLDDEAGGGLRLEAVDNGPGIRDFEEALTDGFSTKGSLGYGLGTVHRLMDGFELIRPEEGGVRLVCVRRLKRPEHPEGQSLIDIGAATRAYPGMEQNGDAFVIHRWGERALVGVIDGLGHGQFAHRAAQKASQYIDSHYDQLLPDIFRNVGRTCRATRGIVMALAAFDCGRGTLSFASVGQRGGPGVRGVTPTQVRGAPRHHRQELAQPRGE